MHTKLGLSVVASPIPSESLCPWTADTQLAQIPSRSPILQEAHSQAELPRGWEGLSACSSLWWLVARAAVAPLPHLLASHDFTHGSSSLPSSWLPGYRS